MSSYKNEQDWAQSKQESNQFILIGEIQRNVVGDMVVYVVGDAVGVTVGFLVKVLVRVGIMHRQSPLLPPSDHS